MEMAKTAALQQLERSSIANQQALVKKIAGPQLQKPIKFIIPAGKSLTADISKEQLPEAIFNWLRRVRHFKEVLISFCENISKRNSQTSTVTDFNTSNNQPEWELHGKKWLAERIAEALNMDNVLGVKINKEGIHIILDQDESFDASSDDWQPYCEFQVNKPSTF